MDPFILLATASFQKEIKLYLSIGKVPLKKIGKVSFRYGFFQPKKCKECRFHFHPKFHEKINKPQKRISAN